MYLFKLCSKSNSRTTLPFSRPYSNVTDRFENLSILAKEKGIKFFMVNYSDVLGTFRSKLVPTSAMVPCQKSGVGFAGHAAWFNLTPADADVMAIPDPSSFQHVPFNKELGWVSSDLYINGKPLEQSPRWVLKRQRDRALLEGGWVLKTGVECEFFILRGDGQGPSDKLDFSEKPCYEQQSLWRRYDVITEISEAMEELGWKPTQSDHEDANGQFEMNWEFDDCLVTADRHAFFKFMVKAICEKFGFRATFMPKPFPHLTGNGCHVHVSLHDHKTDKNLFIDNGDPENQGLSPLAYNFIGGILTNARSMCSLTNPTVNSYKRLNSVTTRSGSTWSPNSVSYTGNNRTHMIRIPDSGRFEFRLPDGAVNPYILPSVLLAAGTHGIKKKISPGKRMDFNLYSTPVDSPLVKDLQRLPQNLLDGLRLTEENDLLRETLGLEYMNGFQKLSKQRWLDYCASLSQWETDTTFDC